MKRPLLPLRLDVDGTSDAPLVDGMEGFLGLTERWVAGLECSESGSS